MCDSKACGGQRCSAGTRPKYEEYLADAESALRRRGCFPSGMNQENLEKYATLHASTVDGAEEINEAIYRISNKVNPLAPKPAEMIIGILTAALKEGQKLRETNKEVRKRIKLAEGKHN